MPASGRLQQPLEPPWPVDGLAQMLLQSPKVVQFWPTSNFCVEKLLVGNFCGAPSQTSAPPVCTDSTLAPLSYTPTGPGADAGPSLSDADWSRWQVELPVCGWTAQPVHHFEGGGEWFFFTPNRWHTSLNNRLSKFHLWTLWSSSGTSNRANILSTSHCTVVEALWSGTAYASGHFVK